MPEIESVEVCVASVPLSEPVVFSTRTVTRREYCLVRIRSTDGDHGIGFSYAVNGAGRLLAHAIEDVFAPRLIGDDSHRTEGIWRDLYQESLLLGRAGATMRALSAVDQALWDLNARSVGLPLYKYLGASRMGRVPAYGSGGYYIAGKSNDDLAREMQGFVEAGHDAVKMKVGARSPAEEEARVRAVREAIGPDIHLMLDANNAWRDLPEALRTITRLEQFDPYWIEEPFSPDDIDNHVRLAAATRIPVATGEIEAGRWRFKDLAARGAATILQTDAIVCGGITEFRRIAATAASHGLTMAPHAWHDVHAHLVAACENASYVEFMPDDSIVNFRNIIDHQLELENGDLVLSDRPGFGFDFDEDKLARFGWSEGNAGPWKRLA
ncbi:mandelate racemase/muconate lactonizing enzyme family protein [Roseitranquillus sediminis]|uniref:mandelate racemase/muconate lactonizing enzyme family protein n=1 Tax=Roseitranquillus sediminis TaxID=2809051 RepID=UPI001D0C65D2|nr:mandelate racemase/muconate lactonizing enzyme family protein [Roseitranquillus sediminis]MBM9593487.1 mandelate racemase/muconate lactonizing enzyme family protein [Roseitranquillus sediminis]